MTERFQPARWPSVTAIVPTRGRPRELERAVRSVLGQRYPGRVGCLVVFDQQDPEPVPVHAPEDRPLRLLTNDRTPGLAGARNTGILAADSDLVAFLDDDDAWRPDKLARQVAALEAHPDAVAVTCGVVIRTGRRQVVRVPASDLVTIEDLIGSRRTEVHSSTILARTAQVVGDIGLIDEAIPGSYGEDYDWLLRAASRGPLAAVRDPLVEVYWQGSYFSDRWRLIAEALSYQLDKHPELLTHRRNRARMYGRMAFAFAAAGEVREAWRWAGRSIRDDWRQPRGYLAYLVSLGLPPQLIQRMATLLGRGI